MPAVLPRSSTRSHPLDQVLAVATVVLAAVSVLCALLGLYGVGAVLALAGVLVGGWSQMVSRTLTERWESVLALGVAAVTLVICLNAGDGLLSGGAPWTAP